MAPATPGGRERKDLISSRMNPPPPVSASRASVPRVSGPKSSLRAAIRRKHRALASGNHHARVAEMFHRARNTTIHNANFTINHYGGIVPTNSHTGVGAGTSTSSLSEEYDPPLSRQRESPELYAACLLTKARGFPLWVPSPSMTMPILNRQLGVSLGDVGILTPEGSFDYLFNIFHDAMHPINAAIGVPEGFVSFSPGVEFKRVACNAGSFLADPSIVRVDNGSNRFQTIIKATGPEAAVLMTPEDVHVAGVYPTEPLRSYIEENIVAWYKFVKHTLRRNLENGDLQVVYNCHKSSGFGVATAFNTAGQQDTKLTFSVDSTRANISGCPYHWSHTGSAEVKAGPTQHENSDLSLAEPVRNQCLFVKTIGAKVSDKIWKRIEKLAIATTKGKRSVLTFNPIWPLSFMQQFTGESSTQGTSSHQYNERVVHPSAILYDILETMVPGAGVYMVCDDDWENSITNKDMDACDFVTQVLKRRIIVEHQEMAYFGEDVNHIAISRPEKHIPGGSYRWNAIRKNSQRDGVYEIRAEVVADLSDLPVSVPVAKKEEIPLKKDEELRKTAKKQAKGN